MAADHYSECGLERIIARVFADHEVDAGYHLREDQVHSKGNSLLSGELSKPHSAYDNIQITENPGTRERSSPIMTTELLHRELIYYLQGLGFQIHTTLGGGHAEQDYENALVHALEIDNVAYVRQPVYRVQYRGRQVGEYRPDIVIADGRVLLELKSTPLIEPLHIAQTISYLAVTGAELGLIMNFGGSSMQYKRVPNFLQQYQSTTKSVASPDGLIHLELTQVILDGLFEVHRTLGAGFLHQVYRRAARIELLERGLTVKLIKELPLRFRGSVLRVLQNS